MTVGTIKMTAQQYLQLGEDPPGVRLELVNGEVAVSPSPELDHTYTSAVVMAFLIQHVLRHQLGQVFNEPDVVLGPHQVRRPDVVFVARNRVHLLRKVIEVPPDLCVEIISPSSASIDRADKFGEYQAFGVAHYWIVDPAERTIEAYRLKGGHYVSAGGGKGAETVYLPPFPELEIPLAQLWRPE